MRLGQMSPHHLGVIARTSAAQYRQTGKTAAEIGQELQANYLLQGSVRREGNHLHVTAQLIQATDQTHGHGTHTWPAFWKQYLLELLQESRPKSGD